MLGDDRSRFCNQCQLHVYNLSAMSAPEAASLVQQKEGRLCVRYYTRPDGTMLTQDCPVGFQAARRRVLSRLATAAAALVGLAACRWWGDRAGASPKKGAPAKSQPLMGSPPPPPRVMMGDVAPPTKRPATGQPAPPPHVMGKIAAPGSTGFEMGEVVVQRPQRRPPQKSVAKKGKPARSASGKKAGQKGRT
jgi:hypothetical protein